MDKKQNLRIISGILFRPRSYFEAMAGSPPAANSFLLAYGLPLLVVGSAGRMARALLYQPGGLDLRGDQLAGIFLISLSGYLLSIWLGSHLIAKLGKPFNSKPSAGMAMLLVMAAYTPYMLFLPVSALSPGLSPLRWLGLLYTAYLFWAGCGYLMETPGHHRIGYTLVSFFILLGLSHIFNLVFTSLLILNP